MALLSLCGLLAAPGGPCGDRGAGSCFFIHPTPGCDIGDCCTAICRFDPYCCEIQWDITCVVEADDLCAGRLACPGTENCYTAHATPGCATANCCDAVCLADPFCCDTQWDGTCADDAAMACGNCGEPGAGNCLMAHAGTGCNLLGCCQLICQSDTHCCDQQWDELCASAAATACQPSCPWDCADLNGAVTTADFLALLGRWGLPGPICNFDGGTVGTTDFLALLQHWGACP